MFVQCTRGGVLTVFHVQEGRIDVEGDESQAVSEDFVGDDRCVAPHVHAFYAYGRYLRRSVGICKARKGAYLCDEDASEGIGDGGIDADEIKVDGAIRETFDADGETLHGG